MRTAITLPSPIVLKASAKTDKFIMCRISGTNFENALFYATKIILTKNSNFKISSCSKATTLIENRDFANRAVLKKYFIFSCNSVQNTLPLCHHNLGL